MVTSNNLLKSFTPVANETTLNKRNAKKCLALFTANTSPINPIIDTNFASSTDLQTRTCLEVEDILRVSILKLLKLS